MLKKSVSLFVTPYLMIAVVAAGVAWYAALGGKTYSLDEITEPVSICARCQLMHWEDQTCAHAVQIMEANPAPKRDVGAYHAEMMRRRGIPAELEFDEER